MRSVQLLMAAVEAERLRLRLMGVRQLRRAVVVLAAIPFALLAFVLAEIAGWEALLRYMPVAGASLAMLGVNLLLAALLGVVAFRSSPGPQERDARAVRQQALSAGTASLIPTASLRMAGVILQALWRSRRRTRRK